MRKNLYILLWKLIKNTRIRRLFEKKIAMIEGGFAYSETIRKIYEKKYGLSIGYGTYGGCWNNKSLFWQNIKIGNYCSFANNVYIYRANHPIDIFTSHPITYNPIMGGVEHYTLTKLHLEIGHDVWIGQNVIILPACKSIGNGVVIGAGAVVTKDVPAYSIVAGNPAKIIRYRFQNDIIDKIEDSQWWFYSKKELLTKLDFLYQLTQILHVKGS